MIPLWFIPPVNSYGRFPTFTTPMKNLTSGRFLGFTGAGESKEASVAELIIHLLAVVFGGNSQHFDTEPFEIKTYTAGGQLNTRL